MNMTLQKAGILITIGMLAGILSACEQASDGGQKLSPTPQSQSPQPTSQSTPTPTVGQIRAGWESLVNEQVGIKVGYPPSAEVNDVNPNRGVFSLVEWGPTQRENTEFYDGLNLTFDSGQLPAGTSLEAYVNNRADEQAAEPVVENVSEVTQVTYAGKTGYQYRVTSLGERAYIYLPKNEDEYIRVTNSTQDPTNQGFEQTAEEILNSIQVME